MAGFGEGLLAWFKRALGLASTTSPSVILEVPASSAALDMLVLARDYVEAGERARAAPLVRGLLEGGAAHGPVVAELILDLAEEVTMAGLLQPGAEPARTVLPAWARFVERRGDLGATETTRVARLQARLLVADGEPPAAREILARVVDSWRGPPPRTIDAAMDLLLLAKLRWQTEPEASAHDARIAAEILAEIETAHPDVALAREDALRVATGQPDLICLRAALAHLGEREQADVTTLRSLHEIRVAASRLDAPDLASRAVELETTWRIQMGDLIGGLRVTRAWCRSRPDDAERRVCRDRLRTLILIASKLDPFPLALNALHFAVRHTEEQRQLDETMRDWAEALALDDQEDEADVCLLLGAMFVRAGRLDDLDAPVRRAEEIAHAMRSPKIAACADALRSWQADPLHRSGQLLQGGRIELARAALASATLAGRTAASRMKAVGALIAMLDEQPARAKALAREILKTPAARRDPNAEAFARSLLGQAR